MNKSNKHNNSDSLNNTSTPKTKLSIKTILLLHILLCVYSVTGILSKFAAGTEFLSLQFILLYGGVLLILVIYAIGWQQVLKRMPLTAAFANKAVTVIWGLVWGVLFFSETITIGKIIGAALVIGGIVLYSFASRSDDSDKMGG